MKISSRRWINRRTIAAAAVLLTAGTAWAIVTNLTLVERLHDAQAAHVDQQELLSLVQAGQHEEAFTEAFEEGDELFETTFNALDGGGANVGNGQRFTRVPRADLTSPGAWATHTPERATGPNGQACNECHSLPFDDGAGDSAANVHRDPTHSARLDRMIQRNTPHVFAPGAVQKLAEEMSTELAAIRSAAIASACAGATSTRNLVAKGVGFGSLTARPTFFGGSLCSAPFFGRRFVLDTSRVSGIATDLVVRPFQWKGSVAFLRDFNRGASHNELGMQAVEITGDGVDGDSDGVVDEMTVGDQTALSIYLAAQPRPVTKLELDQLGLVIPALTSAQKSAINRGSTTFANVGCAGCHVPSMKLDNAIFSEPSLHPAYRDAVFPAGQNPVARGVTPQFPVRFDLTRDQPDNRIIVGGVERRLGSLAVGPDGKAIVQLYSDLKRHDIGIAESIDEVGTGPSVFLTEALWGVGSTAPYLHDGRATTLTEAILEHGGEASGSRNAFLGLSPASQADVIAFLDNLVLFKIEEE